MTGTEGVFWVAPMARFQGSTFFQALLFKNIAAIKVKYLFFATTTLIAY
jgi:hypothetical protein